MGVVIVSIWVAAAGVFLPVQPPPSDLHVVFERQFNFLASVRTTTTEWWLAPAKSALKQGDRVTITRDDLGVRWRIDAKAGTYTEEKIAPAAPTPPPTQEDIHTAGYEYEPQYDWKVSESGRKTTIAGRPCRQFIAIGDADYAEATVKFWVCEPITGISYPINDGLIGQLSSESARTMVGETALKHGKAWVLGVEETQEPAISPTMTITVSVKTLEATQAPAGTFDLPANVKKAGAR
jgi:hypothetical protein